MFADAIATGGGRGQLPFAPDEGKKRIANPITDDPDAGDRFTGTIIDGPKHAGHFRECLGPGHGRARTHDPAFAVVVFPPEGDPVPASAGFSFLEAASLKAAPANDHGLRNNRYVLHSDRDHSIRIAEDRVVSEWNFRSGRPGYFPGASVPNWSYGGRLGRVWKASSHETGTASWLLTTPYWSDEMRMSPAIDPDDPAKEYHLHHSR